jgi:hypothetical protein
MIILSRGQVFADGEPMELFRNQELMDRSDLEVPLSLQNRDIFLTFHVFYYKIF